MKKITTAAVAALLLAACAAGPGKADIEKALAAFIERTVFQTPTFQTLDIGKCVEDTASAGFVCAVEGQVAFTDEASGRTFEHTLAGTYVFGEVGGEWKVISQR